MLSTHLQNPFKRDVAFFLVLCFGMWMVSWDSTLGKLPGEPHLWRQSDCISIAEYYAKGNGFFTPEMHSRISDDWATGKTVAEFPIIYYIVGKIWSVTGVHYWIFRLFNALLGIIALWCLYKTLLRITNGCWLWSALGPLLVLASPVYAYYGISFLTNVPAFDCTLIAWYFFARYYSDGKTKYLIWTAVFFALSGLLKISAFTSYVILLFVLFADATKLIRFKAGSVLSGGTTQQQGRIFNKPLIAAAILLLPAAISALWQLGFVEPYCNEHYGRYSFTSPMPIWDYTAEQRSHIWEIWFRYTMHQVYPGYVWWFFIAAFGFLLYNFRRVNKFWLISIPAMFIGHTAFAFLFFFCLDAHDYYHADIIFFFVLVYAALVKYLRTHQTEMMNSAFTKFIAIFFVYYSLLSCSSNMHLRFFGYYSEQAWCEQFNNRYTLDFLTYFNDQLYLKRSYYKVGDELTRHGFSDTTVVIAINDNSFNSELVMMNRPGFTNIDNCCSDSATTALRIERGAQLLIVENPDAEARGITHFMDYKLFTVDHIAVYDLRPYAKK